MPGFGVADAASTIVGQSIGAKRPAIAKKIRQNQCSHGDGNDVSDGYPDVHHGTVDDRLHDTR